MIARDGTVIDGLSREIFQASLASQKDQSSWNIGQGREIHGFPGLTCLIIPKASDELCLGRTCMVLQV